ncbi:hypothetical protein HD806DRAFT_551545 [Xylariaceae sp. AK1471]|nr:hypothetical protein HD806DRAFT_551545 [Xylariaceae sp. AK1471]
MSSHPKDSIIQLGILSQAIIGLVIAGLNSANAHFAIILRDRARSGLITSVSTISDIAFISLMQKILVDTVVTTIICAIFAVIIVTRPILLQDFNKNWTWLCGSQIILELVLVITGGYLAGHVNGFQTSFDQFGGDENLPYYNIMYYGGVAQAAYGALVIVLLLCIYFITTGERDTGRAAVHKSGAEEMPQVHGC